MSDDVLDDTDLARRWKMEGTPEAIAKRFQRLRALPKANPRHLKSFPVGNQKRYRLADIIEYEARAKNSLLWLSSFSKDDELAEWTRLARLAGLIEDD